MQTEFSTQKCIEITFITRTKIQYWKRRGERKIIRDWYKSNARTTKGKKHTHSGS